MMIETKNRTLSFNFQNSILLFFILGSLFPTIRIILIGSDTSKNYYEYFISSIFDLAVILIIIYSFIRIIKNSYLLEFTYFDWMVLIFILSNVILGAILSQNMKISMYGFRLTYLPNLFYFVFRFNNLDLKQVDKIFKNIFNWFVGVAVAGIILYFGFYNFMVDMISLAGGVVNNYFITRMTSVFWTPVLFASFMTITFLYYYYRITSNYNWKNYIVLSLLWLCILLSVSRGAFVVLFFGLLMLTIYSNKWKILLTLIVIMAILFIGISFYIGSPLEFIVWILKSTSGTLNLEKGISRVDLWIKAFSDFKEHPFGFGLGKAGHVAARFFEKNSTLASVSSTDGWFLKIAGETGVWGLFSYLSLALAFTFRTVRSLKFSTYTILHFLFIFFVVVNIQCIVSNVIDFYLLSYLFWLSIGMAESINNKSV